jgi:hypothetical protein
VSPFLLLGPDLVFSLCSSVGHHQVSEAPAL